jgi:lysophospholipase L1-like esterase
MQRKLLVVWISIIIVISSCGGGSNAPTSPAVLDTRQMQPIPTHPSDDTLGSGIAVVIAAVGDSITYGVGSTGGGYPPMLEEKLRAAGHNVIVRNEGVPGEQAYETNMRFWYAIRDADIALLMIGTNDLWAVGTSNDKDPVGYIELMIDQAQVAGTIPIVGTIPPQFGCIPDQDLTIRKLNSQIQAITIKQEIQLVDTYHAILAHGGAALYSDCRHFNDQGYRVLADAFYNAVLTHPLIRNH